MLSEIRNTSESVRNLSQNNHALVRKSSLNPMLREQEVVGSNPAAPILTGQLLTAYKRYLRSKNNGLSRRSQTGRGWSVSSIITDKINELSQRKTKQLGICSESHDALEINHVSELYPPCPRRAYGWPTSRVEKWKRDFRSWQRKCEKVRDWYYSANPERISLECSPADVVYVYLLAGVSDSGRISRCKIGSSANVGARSQNIFTQRRKASKHVGAIKLVAFIPFQARDKALSHERMLHRKFLRFRKKTKCGDAYSVEWFGFNSKIMSHFSMSDGVTLCL